ncbi:MAG: hypothetical protein D6701_10360 [Gemmatimonadetes bacterium]|nr:MAG: hypothetical protein D6701_10360 [Gemmatimonadota bacterium]
MMDRRSLTRAAALGLVALASAACSDSSGPDGAAEARVTLSLAVPVASGGTAQAAPGPAGVFSQTDGQNTLEITRVAMVVREVELERMFEGDCMNSGPGDDDGCEEFEVGPFLLELPLDDGFEAVFSIDVPEGTYDEVEFDIHKPSDDTADDLAFLNQHPDFTDVSIRVEGTYNGEPFVFLQDTNDEQERALQPPLVVGPDTGPVNVTLDIDISTWFRRSDGTLIDPMTANKNGENENLVENNIRNSIDAFEDDDRDGDRD